MNRFYAVTDRIAAFSLMAFLAIPDLLATTKVLATQPWESSADVPRPWAAAPASGNSKSVSMNAPAAPAAATLTFDEAHSAFLNSHPSDALNKPNDDVYRFDLSSDPTQNVAVRFSAQGGTLGITVNGEHYLPVAGQEVVIAKELLREGTNTLLFSATSSLPTSVNRVEVRPSNKAASRELVLSSASSADFSVLEVNAGMAFALDRGQTAAIPVSLTNVTRGAIAYRSLDRKEFVRVRIGVNRTLGVSKLREARVMYFDYPSRSWKEARVHAVDHAAFSLEAEVPGGTDYFAALIKSPEMPEAAAFMPTAISDLEPKSPAEGITLVQPPTANQQGDANISYPLSIPAGRQGMTPQLALNYSSSGGESWCGYGWSIPVQSISVDTRWGVPTFDDTLQSEVYLLDGESLHEEGGKKANRPTVSGSTVTYPTRSSGALQFFPKQQSSYRKVVRHGTGTNNYYWVVTEADGTSNYYGCTNATALNTNGVLTTTNGDITRWYLMKTEDRFGNNIVYTYETVVHPAGSGLKEAGKTMFLKKIQYTGNGSTVGKYTVEFITSAGREDGRISLNSGVKEVDDRKLNRIEVSYDGQLVKDYRLTFKVGDFGKRLLEAVGEYHGNQLFYQHKFTYHSAGTTLFESTPKKIKFSSIPSAPSMFADMPFYSLINQAQVAVSPSHIKTTKTTGWSVGGSVGFGFVPNPKVNPNSKEWTLSGKLNYSEAYSHDRYTLQDVNGDGLSDLLIANDINTNYSYRPLIIENGTPRFGAKKNVASDRLYSSVSRSINTGADYLTEDEIFSAGVNWNYTTSKVRRYLLDYNGDGFLDRVVPKGGAFQVEFGTLQPGGTYQFESNSMYTLNPVLQKEALVTVEDDSLKNFEVVKIWTAPVTGRVDIASDPQFSLGVTGQATVSIQHEESFIQLPTNFSSGSAAFSANRKVLKGEQLLFRLAPDGTGDQDLIEWNPEVSYTSTLPADGNNSNYTASSYQNSYVLSGGEGVSFNKTDLIKVDFNRDGFGFSDDVYFNIWVDETDTAGNGTTTSLLFTNRLGQSATGFSSFSAPFIGSFNLVPGLSANRIHRLRFEVMSHSNIDWTKTSWRPTVEIKTDCDANPIVFYPNVRYGMYNSVHQLDGPTSLTLPTGSYEISPEVNENKADIDGVFNNISNVNLDQKVYFVIKSGGKTLSKKVLVLHKDHAFTDSNSLKLYTLDQATGTPLVQVTPTQYTGAATAVFNASQISNGSITIEYFAEESPFAFEAIKYVKAKLGQTRVITSSGAVHSSWSSGVNKNMFYGKTDLFNTRWLGWGQFAWSGEVQAEILKADMSVGGSSVFGTSTSAIESLEQEQIMQANPWDNPFFTMMPVRGENAKGLWSYENALFNSDIKKDHYSVFGSHLGFYRDSDAAVTGLFGEEEKELNTGNASSSVYAAAAAAQVTRSSSLSGNLGQSLTNRRTSMSTSLLPNDFYSNSSRMFQDFNGDGYPDLVQQNGQNVTMQLTNPTGGHTASFVAVANERNSKSHSNGGGVMVNGNYKNEDQRFVTKSISFGVNVGTTYQTIEYEDVNGDGLMDRVYSDQDLVALNNGRGFDPKRSMSIPILSINQSTVAPPSLSAGLSNTLQGMSKRISNKNESFTAGIGVNTSGSRSKSTSFDVNGDGLNDILVDNFFNDSLFVNTGTGYQLWSGPSGQIGVALATSPNQSQNFGLTADAAATIGFPVLAFSKISISGNGGLNFAVNKTRSSFADFNGDGAVDLVTSDENGDLLIYYSKLVKSNFLTKVENPLGGSFEITYDLVGHQRGSYPAKVKTHRVNERMIWDMPSGKWVMASVKVNDGLNIFNDYDPNIDGEDQTEVFFAYDGGIQNRREKEFAGFTRVETRQQNQLGSEASYPRAYLTEVVEYFAPIQLDFESIKRHSYQKGLVQATYSLYHHEINSSSRTTKLVSLQNSTYAFRVVDISTSNKGTVTPSGSSWANVNWNTLGESQTIFPAVVATEAINYPQIADTKYHSQRFELEYDAYFNVVRYQDKAEMTPGGIAEVVVDAVASVTTLEHIQVNSCLNLPAAFFDDGVVKGYAIVSTKLGYSNDTLWLTTAPLGTCPSPNEFNVDICAVMDRDSFATQHYKDTVVITRTYRTVTTATYTSDRIATMEYFSPANAAGRTNVLQNHRIYLGAISPTTLVRESNVLSLTADKKSVQQLQTRLDAAGNFAQTDLLYDAYGNVTKLTGPANHLNQRAFTNYTYDNTLNQFVVAMSNQFAESTCAIYDLATGLLKQTVDPNGQPMAFEYDQFKRIKNVWAPKELRNPASAPTISYSYTPYAAASGSIPAVHAVAVTTHNLATALSATSPSNIYTPNSCALINLASRPGISTGVRTATIVDGLARPVQIHKEQSNGSNMSDFIVSGVQTLDKFGRVTQVYVDRTASSGFGVLQQTNINPAALLDDLIQRNITYDYLNRPLSSETWFAQDGTQGQWTTTENQYGWNQDLLGVDHYFEKVSVLSSAGPGSLTPNSVNATFTDSRGRKVGQITYGATTPENIVTQFDYNDLGELVGVTDPIGEQTTYTYDLAGRVKTENHPDRGLTTTTYDKASNVIAINTPATQSFGGSITMSYSYNRLVKKYMPNSSGTDLYDVDYIYGSYNDGRNGVGRIISITQGGGFKSDSYRYDELGQRVEEDIKIDVPMYGIRDFNTKKYFDSFGRILQAVYPDGDQVDYDYNSLGELNTIKSKVAGVTQDIVSAISYNGYGQISQLTYGNGTTTSYSYATGNTNKATTLMGSTVNAKEQGASAFTPVLNRTYTYNKQGMVAQMNRSVAGSLLSQVGSASFTDAYTYDQFGRLDAHAQSKGGTSIYSLDMQYNQAGGITFKTSNGSGFMNASALNYDLSYSYSGNYGHQLERIDDPVNASTTYFTYNTSGSITQIDDPSQAIAQNFFWNEQQQLTGVSNQQGVHHYVYDHSGERIMKSSLINSKVYLNDQVIDDVSNLEPYTVYVNPYYVVTGLMGGDRVSKHYYMNQQRVATDITINYDPNGTGGGEQEQSLAKDPASAAPELSPALTNFSEVLVGLGQKPLDTASLKLPTIESYYPEAAKNPATSSSAESNPSAPRILFWYHPDYLGNVDLITERDGYTHEFFMYSPWGEEMHQWNANTYAFTSPYRFNSKELDPETGLAYYGARYYQNKIGVWLSVDRYASKYPTLTPYNFCNNNSQIFSDPTGDTIVISLLKPGGTKANDLAVNQIVKNQKNDGIFIIKAHASPKYIQDDRWGSPRAIYEDGVFKILESNKEFREARQMNLPICVIFSGCNSAAGAVKNGSYDKTVSKPLAQRFSELHPEITVKGADGYTQWGRIIDQRDGVLGRIGGYGLIGVRNSANNGGWITFKNGRMLNKVIVGDVMKEANNHDKKIIFK